MAAIVIRNFDYEPEARHRGGHDRERSPSAADGSRHSVTADHGSFDTHDLDGGARAR
ncbi:MAG: hypothetical protein U0W40_03795 [Acidimicrobiia bacterium]